MRFRRYSLFAATIMAAVLSIGVLPFAQAQVPSIPPPPYNTPVPAPTASTPTKQILIVNQSATPGTVNSNLINALAYKGVICSITQTADSGSPSVSINVQEYDTASQTYFTIATSGVSFTSATGTGTALNVPTVLQVYPGIAVSGLPTGMTGVSLHVPRFFRIQQITSTGASFSPAHTGVVGCDLLI